MYCNLFYDQDGLFGGIFGDCDGEDSVFVLGLDSRPYKLALGEKNFSEERSFLDFEQVGLKGFGSVAEIVGTVAFDGEGITLLVESDLDILVGDSGEFCSNEKVLFGFEDIDFRHPAALADKLRRTEFPVGVSTGEG